MIHFIDTTLLEQDMFHAHQTIMSLNSEGISERDLFKLRAQVK